MRTPDLYPVRNPRIRFRPYAPFGRRLREVIWGVVAGLAIVSPLFIWKVFLS